MYFRKLYFCICVLSWWEYNLRDWTRPSACHLIRDVFYDKDLTLLQAFWSFWIKNTGCVKGTWSHRFVASVIQAPGSKWSCHRLREKTLHIYRLLSLFGSLYPCVVFIRSLGGCWNWMPVAADMLYHDETSKMNTKKHFGCAFVFIFYCDLRFINCCSWLFFMYYI